MFNTIVEAGAVEAGAASRYGSGSDQKMRLLAAPAPQHWGKVCRSLLIQYCIDILNSLPLRNYCSELL
jgi:hypothetical protein